MSDSISVLLGALLIRTITVGAVLLAIKYAYEGAFLVAGTFFIGLSFSAYLLFTDARLLQ